MANVWSFLFTFSSSGFRCSFAIRRRRRRSRRYFWCWSKTIWLLLPLQSQSNGRPNVSSEWINKINFRFRYLRWRTRAPHRRLLRFSWTTARNTFFAIHFFHSALYSSFYIRFPFISANDIDDGCCIWRRPLYIVCVLRLICFCFCFGFFFSWIGFAIIVVFESSSPYIHRFSSVVFVTARRCFVIVIARLMSFCCVSKRCASSVLFSLFLLLLHRAFFGYCCRCMRVSEYVFNTLLHWILNIGAVEVIKLSIYCCRGAQRPDQLTHGKEIQWMDLKLNLFVGCVCLIDGRRARRLRLRLRRRHCHRRLWKLLIRLASLFERDFFLWWAIRHDGPFGGGKSGSH